MQPFKKNTIIFSKPFPMKKTFIRALFLCGIFSISIAVSAQSKFPILSLPNNSGIQIGKIAQNSSINADSAYKKLNNWSLYPALERAGREFIYYYIDSIFGKIPVRIYIPSDYNNAEKTPCVLMLHGATGVGTFTGIDSLETFEPPSFFSALRNQNYIIIQPISDRDKHFNWAVNQFGGTRGISPNLTYSTLSNILISLKKVLNIDDNRIYVLGHSDGSDGAISMGVYVPGQFAGIVAYNSMLNIIFGKDFYIRNIQNRPAYIVHSDLDDLRPIQMARVIIDSLVKIDYRLNYKEYINYKHEDKHLDKDIAYAVSFFNTQTRNPFQAHICWETNKDTLYNSCDWLKITKIDTLINPAKWYTVLNFGNYDKVHKLWMKEYPYYFMLQKSAEVKASYINNIFNIESSRVTEIELLISPVMVNLEQPVIISVNGKQVFNGKITADKDFLLKNFEKTFDRQALWVNSVKVKIN